MPDPDPLLSIVVATHGRAGGLPDLVDLLAGQVDDRTEVVVVDDGSTDDTAEVLARLATDRPWLVVLSTPNGRLSRARNAGAARATGRWLLFLDDDDRPRPGWAEAFRRRVASDPGGDLALVSCGVRYVDPAGTVSRSRLPGPMGAAFSGVTGRFMGGTTAVRADLFASVDGFRPDQPTSHMTELVLRLLDHLDDPVRQVAAIAEPLVDIVQAPADQRGRNQPARLLAGTTYLLEAHGDRVRRDPDLFADYAGVAGVAAARAGELVQARRWLARSLRARPSARGAARLAVACVPPLAHRTWPD